MDDFDPMQFSENIGLACRDAIENAIGPIKKTLEEVSSRVPEKGAPGRDGDPGVDGKDGAPGRDGEDGRDGAPGKDGEPGRDGVSPSVEDVVQKMIDDVVRAVDEKFQVRMAGMVLEWERQAVSKAERAIEAMPKPENGKDGRDGDSLSLVDFEYDGERGLTIKYKKNEEDVRITYRMPIVLDAGFFKECNQYEPGDGVTFGGSYWICKASTNTKPASGNPNWRLATAKGKDFRPREARS